jgi:outer membrane protein OmpA-like peptidoglycan-associated protein
MKNGKFLIAVIGLSSILYACETTKKMSNQDKGVVAGVAGGAAAGAAIGKATGNTGLGAVLGAIIGGTAGGLIGNKMDKQAKAIEEIKSAKIEKVNNGEGLKVTFDAGILFSTGSSMLNISSQEALTKFAETLQSNAETNVTISGHTDNSGSDKINQPLSEKRAESVANFLVSKGVNRSRMTTVGNGSNQPVADNSTMDGKAKNRRVEIVIVPNQTMIKQAQEGSLK